MPSRNTVPLLCWHDADTVVRAANLERELHAVEWLEAKPRPAVDVNRWRWL